ncbi:MAG: helix-turn-helix transcriptional regulator [Clostridiaceae bacterium]|nr:helix-turn-helix transcriptional regulator [Clostridiaceae bacterium]
MYDTQKIRLLMLEKQLTQQELAEKAGLNPGTVSRVLITGNAKIKTIFKIAQALNVDITELIRKEV